MKAKISQYLIFIVISLQAAAISAAPVIELYKSPTCGCCTRWAEIALEKGYQVRIADGEKWQQVRREAGLTPRLASCHTAVIDGYVIEGHVPFEDIAKLLAERPDVAGLTAPGMPQMSPGMAPEGQRYRGFSVLSFDRQGVEKLWRRYD